jgi:hypothetical protein
MACIPTPNQHLFATPHGTVHRCPCCGDYEVRFRDTALTVTRTEMSRFRDTVEAVCETDPRGPLCWQLDARTVRQRATFTLWDGEADELAALLDGTLAMLALDDLLADTLDVHLTP